MTVLRVENVTAGYSGWPVLNNVSVLGEAGQTTLVLGPNGAGKSTLAKVIIGLLRLQKGSVRLKDEDVTGLGPHKLVRRGLGYMPQLMSVFSELSVIENLEMGGYTVRGGAHKRIREVLELFPDLAVDEHKKGGTLSGGQQKMLALARLLMTDPVYAILDEPTAGLSPIYAERVWERIDSIRDLGVGLMVVEQNARLAMDHADVAYVLAQGRNVLAGPASEVRDSADLARIIVAG